MSVARYSFFITSIFFASIMAGCSKDDGKNANQQNDKNFMAAGQSLTSDTKKSASYQQMNDSGIIWAGNYPRGNNDDCHGNLENEATELTHKTRESISQDCSYGRDAERANKDGRAGFNYKKVDQEGNITEDSAQSWSCVLDEVTGLLWEIKSATDGIYGNSGLHDGDDLFSWYSNNASINGGAVGSWNNLLNVCSGYIAEQPKTFCNTEEFIQRVNNEGLCGFKDWRVPTRFELESLVNYGRKEPSIDITYFPNTNLEFYWSATPVVNDRDSAWVVNFRSSNTSMTSRQNSFPVRLVRDWTNKK